MRSTRSSLPFCTELESPKDATRRLCGRRSLFTRADMGRSRPMRGSVTKASSLTTPPARATSLNVCTEHLCSSKPLGRDGAAKPGTLPRQSRAAASSENPARASTRGPVHVPARTHFPGPNAPLNPPRGGNSTCQNSREPGMRRQSEASCGHSPNAALPLPQSDSPERTRVPTIPRRWPYQQGTSNSSGIGNTDFPPRPAELPSEPLSWLIGLRPRGSDGGTPHEELCPSHCPVTPAGQIRPARGKSMNSPLGNATSRLCSLSFL